MIDKNTTPEQLIQEILKHLANEERWIKDDEKKAMWKRKGMEMAGRTIEMYFNRWKEKK